VKLWVCKQDLQEFNLTMMNNENSLAQKCKILEIMNIYLTNLLLHREEKTHGLQEGHHEESQKVASKDGNTLWN